MRTTGTMIRTTKFISVYKRFKNEPLRVFTGSEIFPYHWSSLKTYVFVLKALDLIEEVEYYYASGKNNRRRIKGYRLKHDKQEITG